MEREEAVEGTVVFESKPAARVSRCSDVAPLANPREDDEFVYPVANAQPSILSLDPEFMSRPLQFRGLVHRASAVILVDSGASASFVSTRWCTKHHVNKTSLSMTGRLANNNEFEIVGRLSNVSVQLDRFKTTWTFLVADLPGLDVVLGMDFLRSFNPKISWRDRKLTVRDSSSGTLHTVLAIRTNELPAVHSKTIQLCTMQQFAQECHSNEIENEDELWLGVVNVTDEAEFCDDSVLSGKGATHALIRPVLEQFNDVLVQNLPPGVPRDRFALDGRRIEHTIETDPHYKPYTTKPRPLSREDDEELRNVLSELLHNGWITPSLSPYAAPIVFVRKKPDPVTGHRALRMCISYVKLNQDTLNKIAYRLPRIAALIDQVT
jgi:hypothetical protein